LSVAILLGGIAGPAFSQDGLHKIGIVNRKEVFDTYNKQLDEKAKLIQEMAKEKSGLEVRETALKKQGEDYESKKDSMSDEQKRQEQERLRSEYNKLVADGKTAQDKLDSRGTQLVANIRKDIDASVKDIGGKENYHLILDGDLLAPAGSVLYFSTTIDLTSRVTEALNKAYGPRKLSDATSGTAEAPAQDKDAKKKK